MHLHNNINHIIIITAESWLGKNVDPNSMPLKNDGNSISKNNIRKSDGLVIFIWKDIHHSTSELNIPDANCLFTITFNKIKYGIISISWSSYGNIIKFIEDWGSIISNTVSSYTKTTLIIIGNILT